MKISSVLICHSDCSLGRSLIRTFLSKGWQVIAASHDVNEARESLTEYFEDYSDQLLLVQMDTKTPSEVQFFLKRIQKHVSRIDCIINNFQFSGSATSGSAQFANESAGLIDLDRLQVKIAITREFVPWVKENNGIIIATYSLLSSMYFPYLSAECAEQSAEKSYFSSLAAQLQGEGFRMIPVATGLCLDDLVRVEVSSIMQRFNSGLYLLLGRLVLWILCPSSERVSAQIFEIAENKCRFCKTPWDWRYVVCRVLSFLIPQTVLFKILTSIYNHASDKARFAKG